MYYYYLHCTYFMTIHEISWYWFIYFSDDYSLNPTNEKSSDYESAQEPMPDPTFEFIHYALMNTGLLAGTKFDCYFVHILNMNLYDSWGRFTMEVELIPNSDIYKCGKLGCKRENKPFKSWCSDARYRGCHIALSSKRTLEWGSSCNYWNQWDFINAKYGRGEYKHLHHTFDI